MVQFHLARPKLRGGMKIKFCHDNGANIHSCRTEIMNTEDLGLTDDEWREMHEDDRMKMVENWALENFEYWYESEEDEK